MKMVPASTSTSIREGISGSSGYSTNNSLSELEQFWANDSSSIVSRTSASDATTYETSPPVNSYVHPLAPKNIPVISSTSILSPYAFYDFRSSQDLYRYVFITENHYYYY